MNSPLIPRLCAMRHDCYCNLASHACLFQSLTIGFRNSAIQRGVADDDAGCATACLVAVTVFGHSQPPPLCGIVAGVLWVGNRARMGDAERRLPGGHFAWLTVRVG